MYNSPHTATLIHIFDNDSHLNIFHLYRLAISDGEDDLVALSRKGRQWAGEKWWYKLAHVCQRWRNLRGRMPTQVWVILGSVSYLGLCLVCTSGTPVADMLDYSPPPSAHSSCWWRCQSSSFKRRCDWSASLWLRRVLQYGGPTGLYLHMVAEFGFCNYLYPLNALGNLRDTIA